jgi:ribonuclease T1
VNRTTTIVSGLVTALAVVVVLTFAYLSGGGSPVTAPAGSSADACVLPTPGTDGLSWRCLADLPVEGRQTVELIDAGGPFPYDKDGATFNNFEGVLPDQRRGYYREYTVPTPGETDRGARRIVTGDRDRELFYTADHYETFVRVQR